MKRIKNGKNEILKLITFAIISIVCLVLYYFEIKKMDLWPFEMKSRMVLFAMAVLFLIFSIYLSMKKSMIWIDATWRFLVPMGLLMGIMYLPGDYHIYVPVLLPMVLMTLFFGIYSGYFLHMTAIIAFYFSGYMNMEQTIFLMVMGIIIIFTVGICENKVLNILTSILMLIISIILNIVYQYMIYERIRGIRILMQLLPLILTLLPLYVKMAKEKLPSVYLARKLKEINRDDYFLMEKLYDEDSITYYHSMEVSDLAVRVAAELGLNRELAIAGARYHEIGKLLGKNYVSNGVKLLSQHKFPKEVIQIINENNNKLKKPQTMESVVVMLSDTIISTLNTIMETRGMKTGNKAKLVKNILEIRLESGILDDVITDTKTYIRLKQAFVHAYM